jgi:hypothetical protein
VSIKLWITSLVLISIAISPAQAQEGRRLLEENSASVLSLSVKNADGGIIQRGTGFIVSHDGFVLTVAHIGGDQPGQKVLATIGTRGGVENELSPIRIDKDRDLALWRLGQSQDCYRAVWLSPQMPEVADALWGIGFPEGLGLTPKVMGVVNVQGPQGLFIVDSELDHNESGAPVFRREGAVVGIVRGGHPSTGRNNHIIPIRSAANLLTEVGLWPPRSESERYPASCFATCANPSHGVDHWNEERPWNQSSPWLGGGNNQRDVCNGLARSYEQQNPGWSVEIQRTGESSKEEFFRQFFYQYHCNGVAHRGPVYREARSAACGIRKFTP